MYIQSASLRRCASCHRWSGARTPDRDAQAVVVDSEQASGRCTGGPWDGSERRARAACGRWTIWLSLAAPLADSPGNSG